MTTHADSRIVLGVVWLIGGCVPFVSRTADGGPLPLDSARAVAIAQRNVCGRPSAVRDTTCVVRGYEHTGRSYLVILDRRPPAGNDRVAVRLNRTGTDVNVEQIEP